MVYVVTHQKFIAKKILHSMDRYKDVDILCNALLLHKDHTLKFVYVPQWVTKEPPLKLTYVPRPDVAAAAHVHGRRDDERA